jgi:hypothetical protein
MTTDSMEYDLWYRAAIEHAAEIHVPAERLRALHELVLGHMGDAWLAQQRARRDNKRLSIGAMHPLYISLRSSAPRNLADVAELGTYLHAFRLDPKLQDVLADLRCEKFDLSLFELAMAYRWKWAGAEVSLQPPLESGRIADFAAIVDGQRFVVEASAFPSNDLKTDAMHYVHVIKSVLNKDRPAAALAVELTLDDEGTGDVEGTIRRAIHASVNRFNASGEVVAQIPNGNVRVRALGPQDEGGAGDWNVVAHGHLKERPADGTLYNAHLGKTVGRSHSIYVRMPPRTGDVYHALLKKFETERRQLSNVKDPRVVLLDASGVKKDVLSMDLARLQETIGDRLTQLDSVSALWIVSRGPLDVAHFGYRAITMGNPSARVALPKPFVAKASEHEWRYHLISGQEITWQTPRPPIDLS